MGREGIWRESNLYARALLHGKMWLTAARDYQALSEEIYKALEFIRTDACEELGDDCLYEWDEKGLLNFFDPYVAYELEKIRFWCQKMWPGTSTSHIIQMVVATILTGHSPGYLSVRTLPPNQQIQPDRQALLNQKHRNKPEDKNVYQLIWQRFERYIKAGPPQTQALMQEYQTHPCMGAHLILTSPPFLDVIDYEKINWIRNWWLGGVGPQLWHEQDEKAWQLQMWRWMREWAQQLHPDGFLCIEAGKVRKGKVDLIELIIKLAPRAGFVPEELFLQQTSHTRTARCWGVNADQGTTSQQVICLKLA